jgi:hypothetical protein
MDLDRVVAFMAHHREFEKELDRICRIIFNVRFAASDTIGFNQFDFVERFEFDQKCTKVFASCAWKRGDDYDDLYIPIGYFSASDEELVRFGRDLQSKHIKATMETERKRAKRALEEAERNVEYYRKELERKEE